MRRLRRQRRCVISGSYPSVFTMRRSARPQHPSDIDSPGTALGRVLYRRLDDVRDPGDNAVAFVGSCPRETGVPETVERPIIASGDPRFRLDQAVIEAPFVPAAAISLSDGRCTAGCPRRGGTRTNREPGQPLVTKATTA
jgi:hypothetical protein